MGLDLKKSAPASRSVVDICVGNSNCYVLLSLNEVGIKLIMHMLVEIQSV